MGSQEAIVAAFGVHARSLAAWLTHPGLHRQAVPAHVVQTPRALGQVHATEIRVQEPGWRGGDGPGAAGQPPVVACA